MLNVFRNFSWSTLLDLLINLISALTCIILHELSHGYVALLLGDKTAREQGRLTLNPLKHIDPLGLLAFVVLRFGWAKPVQVDPRNFKNPKRGMALTALAGPVMNFLLAAVVLFVFGFILPFTSQDSFIYALFVRIAYFSVVLGIFNLVPIPPLDGSKVLFAVASDELWLKLMRYERYGFILLLALIMFPATGTLLSTAARTVFTWLAGITEFSSHLIGY